MTRHPNRATLDKFPKPLCRRTDLFRSSSSRVILPCPLDPGHGDRRGAAFGLGRFPVGRSCSSSLSSVPPSQGAGGEETKTACARRGAVGKTLRRHGEGGIVHQAVLKLGLRPASRSVSTFQMASPDGGQPGMKYRPSPPRGSGAPC